MWIWRMAAINVVPGQCRWVGAGGTSAAAAVVKTTSCSVIRTGVGQTGSKVVALSGETTSVSADGCDAVVIALSASLEFGTSVPYLVSVVRYNPGPCVFIGYVNSEASSTAKHLI